MISKILIVLISVGVLFLVIGGIKTDFLSSKIKKNDISLFSLKINNASLNVELADTPEKRLLGLGGRKKLGKNNGMIFLYSAFGFYPFWMKDMNFALDIVWIDENYKIIDITKGIQPDTFPKTFVSQMPSQYILEVNDGWINKNNVNIGDSILFGDNILKSFQRAQ